MTGHRLTVGVVTPHAAPGPEVELPAMTGGRVATVVYRTGSPPEAPRTPSRAGPPAHARLSFSTEPAALERASRTFTGTALDTVAHASTTAGYVLGKREEAVRVDRLAQHFGVPAVASCAAAAAALRTVGAERVQLVHPPWFDDEFDELGSAYFRSQGLEVVVTKAVGLPDDPARVDAQPVVDWVEQHADDRAEGIFLAGNGFRAAAAVEELELRTGRPVVEANQALLYGVLVAMDASWDVTGHGRLLRLSDGTGRRGEVSPRG